MCLLDEYLKKLAVDLDLSLFLFVDEENETLAADILEKIISASVNFNPFATRGPYYGP